MSIDIPVNETETGSSSGTTALQGYLYQLDVSVWTALDLLLARKVAKLVTLEPATEEDLETAIDLEPDAFTGRLEIQGYHLIVQCKLRTTGPWNRTDIKRLLAHGTVRTKPRNRLKDVNARYLLITNADLSGVARQLFVDSVGEWPAASDMPADIGSDLPSNAGGRLAILGVMDQEKLSARTARLLTERFRIPISAIDACNEALRREALARMSGAAGGVWDRESIERIITEFGGYIGSSEAMEGYVPPTNWEELKNKLATQHAIVITGASGTGKTRTAKALIADLRDNTPGIRHVYVQGGPEKVQGDAIRGDVVYEIEDPWGRFRVEPLALPWNDALNDILKGARPNRKFVVTTRSDVLQESKPRGLLDRWFVSLEEENYGTDQRIRLFEHRLRSIPRQLQSLVLSCRPRAIERLVTPLEIERFFSTVMDGPFSQENDAQYVERCLKEAHHTSIESSLVYGVQTRQAWALAAIVWGLFKAQPRLSFNVVPPIQSGLSRRSADLEDSIEPFLHLLIAGRNVRQTETVLSYQHPRVEQGLEEALNEKPDQSSRVLGYLLDTLVELDNRVGGDWGMEGAALLVQAIQGQPKLNVTMSPRVQAKLDVWLDTRVSAISEAFEDDLKLAAAVGSPSSDISELARWLTNKPKYRDWMFLDTWEAPDHPQEWYQRIAANRVTEAICKTFIKRAVPHQHSRFPDAFADAIGRFSTELTPAFLDAALSIISHGYNHNGDVVLEGAVRDLDGFESVVDAAINYEVELRTKSDEEFWLALKNGDYDQEAAEHYYENASEDGYTAGEFLERYVTERRNRTGWQALRGHRRRDGLLWAWLSVIGKDKETDTDEWVAVAEAAIGHSHEYRLWEAVRETVPLVLIPVLEARLREGPTNRNARSELMLTAAYSAASSLVDVIEDLVKQRRIARALSLAADFRSAMESEPDKAAFSEVLSKLTARLPAAIAEAISAIIEASTNRLNPQTLSIIEAIVPESSELKLALARILSAHARDVSAIILGVLEAAGDNSDPEISVVTNAVVLARELGYEDVLKCALSHRFAAVRVEAITGLAEQSEGPLSSILLGLAEDKSSKVRKRLVALLKDRRSEEHTETLIKLAGDSWSDSQRYYNEEANFPIAQAASEILLADLPLIDEDLRKRLGSIVKGSGDLNVKLLLLRAMVRSGTQATKRMVVQLAVASGSPPLHRLAAQALVIESSSVDESLVLNVSDESLRARPAQVACFLAVLVGSRADKDRVLVAARMLAANPDRKALIIMLVIGASEREVQLQQNLLSMLPRDVQEPVSNALSGGAKLAHTLLESLGDVRVVDAVKRWIKEIIE